MEHGEQCVMITGVVWMQVWPANNWASLGTVSFEWFYFVVVGFVFVSFLLFKFPIFVYCMTYNICYKN